MVEVTFVKNQSNWSCGVQIPWDVCSCFGCYLYSADWNWIIQHYSNECSVSVVCIVIGGWESNVIGSVRMVIGTLLTLLSPRRSNSIELCKVIVLQLLQARLLWAWLLTEFLWQFTGLATLSLVQLCGLDASDLLYLSGRDSDLVIIIGRS